MTDGCEARWLADLDFDLEDYDAASRRYRETLDMWQDMGNKAELSVSLLLLGIAALHLDDFEHAAIVLRESLPLLRLSSADLSNTFYITMNLVGLSELARRQKHLIRAARLLGAAEAIVASMGARFGTVWVTHSDIYESLIAAGHEKMDQAAWLEGQAMSVEQATEYALKDSNE